MVEALKQHRVIQLETQLAMGVAWVDCDLVFPNKCGDFIVPATLANHFSQLLKEIGLPRVRLCAMRLAASLEGLKDGTFEQDDV